MTPDRLDVCTLRAGLAARELTSVGAVPAEELLLATACVAIVVANGLPEPGRAPFVARVADLLQAMAERMATPREAPP